MERLERSMQFNAQLLMLGHCGKVFRGVNPVYLA
jgi:hypothetical protein